MAGVRAGGDGGAGAVPVGPDGVLASVEVEVDRGRLVAGVTELAGGEALFVAGDPARRGRVAFWAAGGAVPDLGVAPEWVTVVLPDGDGLREETVPAVSVPVEWAVPVLTRCRGLGASGRASSGMAFWGAAATLGLGLLAKGRAESWVTPAGHGAWRIGRLEGADEKRVVSLAAAMPPGARAVPVAGRPPSVLPAAEATLRAFLDAMADALTRTPPARHGAGASPYVAGGPRTVRDRDGRPPRTVLAPREGASRETPREEAPREAVPERLAPGLRVSLRVEVAGGDDDASFRAVVQLHGLADPSVLADAADVWAGTAAAPELLGPRARSDARRLLRGAARTWPPLARLSAAAAPTGLDLSDGEARDLLGGAAERLAAAGVAVHWPGDLVRALTATGVLEPAPDRRRITTSAAGSFLSSGALVDFRWRIALGGEELTGAEIERLVRAHRPVVRLRGRWVLLDPDLVRRLRTAAHRGTPSPAPVEALRAALTGSLEVDGEQVAVTAGAELEELRARIADPEARAAREPRRQPKALAATLRDYQFRGLNWLHRMTSLGLGACLADDMGLGKTVTLIALHLRRQERRATAGPTLVVCPASLLGNWAREIGRFAPTAPVRRHHGPGRDLAGLETGGFVLTTYGTMRRDAELLAARDWSLVVADEAQHVKNPHAQTARALRRIPSRGRVALTGTPVENNLSELWALLDWTTPGLLGPLGVFRDRYARAVEGDRDAEAARQLAALVRPFLLRRRKSDPGVAPELPPKTETDRPAPLTKEQAALYDVLVRELMAEIGSADGMARRGLVMRLLTGLKQVCNHPAQYLKEPDGGRLGGRSGKLALLDDLLDVVLAEDDSVLVFTQYVAMARLIERHLARRGVPSLLLHGGTPVARREQMVDAFQSGREKVFLLSLKAAGTGLNLTRASHVVHYDRWWNPAVEDQATDRAYRIGQTRPVQVHKLITEGTVEERVAALLRRKRELADAVLGSGEAAFSELGDGELAALVALRGRAPVEFSRM